MTQPRPTFDDVNYVKSFYKDKGVNECTVLSMRDIYEGTLSKDKIRDHSNVVVCYQYTDQLAHDLLQTINFGLDYNVGKLYFLVIGVSSRGKKTECEKVFTLKSDVNVFGHAIGNNTAWTDQLKLFKLIFPFDNIYFPRSFATMLRNTTVNVL